MGRRPEGQDLMGYLLPRTVVGLALWLLIFALGASVSGVVFFVAYERRLTDVQNQMTSVRDQLQQQLNDAVTQLRNADKALASGGVTGTAAGPLGQSARLLTRVGPSMVVVEGTDASGARTSGSGFVLESKPNQAWVLTSYQLVAGSISAAQASVPSVGASVPGGPAGSGSPAPAGPPPAPVATVNVDGADHTGTIYSWDAPDNLALLIVGVGSVPTLQFSNEVPAPGLGVWAVSASGGQFGATAAAGQITAATGRVVTTSAVFGRQATGGPLIDQEGKVIGVLFVPQPSPAPGASPAGRSPSPSPSPSPSGGAAGLAIPVHLACVKVVVCPG
jgi:hypothetical protein